MRGISIWRDQIKLLVWRDTGTTDLLLGYVQVTRRKIYGSSVF